MSLGALTIAGGKLVLPPAPWQVLPTPVLPPGSQPPAPGRPTPSPAAPRGPVSKHVRPGRHRVRSVQGMGLDPITGTLLTSLGSTFINDIFKPPAPSGPTAEQVAALLAQQQAQAERRTLWAIALVGGAALAAVTLSR